MNLEKIKFITALMFLILLSFSLGVVVQKNFYIHYEQEHKAIWKVIHQLKANSTSAVNETNSLWEDYSYGDPFAMGIHYIDITCGDGCHGIPVPPEISCREGCHFNYKIEKNK